MMTELKKQENHYEFSASVDTLNALTRATSEEIVLSCKDLPFLLVNVENPDQFTQINVDILNHLNELLIEANGALVVVLENADTKEIEWEINVVPSYDEGVDFIYMEKIEKELLDGFGE